MEAVAREHLLASNPQIAGLTACASRAPRAAPAVGDGARVGEGKSLYGQVCGVRHGPEAPGSHERVIPRLGGQDFGYLLRQLQEAVGGAAPC
jgi:cytochrome c553